MNWKFKPSDFEGPYPGLNASSANLKLQEWLKDAKVVHTQSNGQWIGHWFENSKDLLYDKCTHKALIINVEPIKACKHEISKVKEMKTTPNFFLCECGVKVKPSGFEDEK